MRMRVCAAENANGFFRKSSCRNNAASNGVVNIMIDIGDAVADFDNLPLSVKGRTGPV